jgi:hypothetical protein
MRLSHNVRRNMKRDEEEEPDQEGKNLKGSQS